MANSVNLDDLQLILLSTAAARKSGSLMPLADSVKNATDRVEIAVTSLIKHGLVGEVTTAIKAERWRQGEDEHLGLFITDAGRALIDGGPGDVSLAGTEPERTQAAPALPRSNSKTAAVLLLLARPEGATTAELIDATGWLPHTTRAALTGLRKKGHSIVREKRRDDTCYRIEGAA